MIDLGLGARACGDCNVMHEADHRIANHLALLACYVRLKSAELAKRDGVLDQATVQLLLSGIAAQIGAVSRLHRSLTGSEGRASVDLGDHLREICGPLAAGLSQEVTLVQDVSHGCTVRSDQILPMAQIVAEVVTNAIKHAGAQVRPTRIAVRCGSGPHGAAWVEVSDTGEGLPRGFDPHADGGLGFRILRGLSAQLGATFDFEPTYPGTRFRLRLPTTPERSNCAAGV